MVSTETIIIARKTDDANEGSRLSNCSPSLITGRKSKNSNKYTKVNHTGEDIGDSAANSNIAAKVCTNMNKTSSMQTGDSSTHSKASSAVKDRQNLDVGSLVEETKQVMEEGEMGTFVKGIFYADPSSRKYQSGEYSEEMHGIHIV